MNTPENLDDTDWILTKNEVLNLTQLLTQCISTLRSEKSTISQEEHDYLMMEIRSMLKNYVSLIEIFRSLSHQILLKSLCRRITTHIIQS